MRGFAAFFQKEIIELQRSYKALILGLVFVLFGFMSPGLAKVMPELFKGMSTGNITISVPSATYLDAYAQFFKNITQMGMIVLLLLFATSLSSEMGKGTFIMPLSKGLSRDAVILSKYAVSLLAFSACYWLSALIDIAYTRMLFGTALAPSCVLSLSALWLFGAFLLALLLFSGTLVSGNYGGLIFCVGIVFTLMAANIIPGVERLSPLYLASQNSALLAGALQPEAMIPSLSITLLSIIAMISGACFVFRNKTV